MIQTRKRFESEQLNYHFYGPMVVRRKRSNVVVLVQKTVFFLLKHHDFYISFRSFVLWKKNTNKIKHEA